MHTANVESRTTNYDIAGIVKKAFTKLAQLYIEPSGFKCAGIYSFDSHLFYNLDYMAADMTNIPFYKNQELPQALQFTVAKSHKLLI